MSLHLSSFFNSAKLAAIAVLLLGQIACGDKVVSDNTGIVHVVVIWLKDAGDLGQRQQIIKASQELAELSLVQSVKVGEVLQSDRQVVDDSYDVALTMHFEDAEALEAYENHPQHKDAVQRVLRPLAKKVIVYDFSVAKPLL